MLNRQAFAITLAAVLAVGIGVAYFLRDSRPGPPTAVPPGPVRLADILASARIKSPLTSLRAADERGFVGAAGTTVFEEDFENFDMQRAGWPKSEFVEIEASPRGRALFLHKMRPRVRPNAWVIPARPNTHYVFERSALTSGPLDADFSVVERSAPVAQGQKQLFPGRPFGGTDLTLKTHWPTRPEPDGGWQTGGVSFFTTSNTQSVAIILNATPQQHEQLIRWGKADLEDSGDGTRFDDLRLERIEPSPRQEMARMKAAALADGADPELGIVKYGQFPPLGDVDTTGGTRDDNYSYKLALYAPPPTDLSFPLSLQADVTLRFSVCLAKETAPGDAAAFEVRVRAGGKERLLWSRSVSAIPAEWVWHPASVDLSEYTGQTVELVLRTRSEVGHPHPMWGNPVLDLPVPDDEASIVILIAVDTLRADRLSSYGYGKPTSPEIDALARDGVRFEHVVSNSNWTCPSFASIFTGLVPARHGVVSLGLATPLSAAFETLAERFQAQGWATQSIAFKVPLYDGGFEQGFDVSFNVPRYYIRAQANLAEALEWLDSGAHRRSFLFLHFNDPHQPFTQPLPYQATFGQDPGEHGIELPFNLEDHHARFGQKSEDPARDSLREVMRGLYDGEVAYVDNRIGAFLEALKQRGLYENAVIAFVSDHGEQLWERGEYGHSGEMLHDEVVRVPLIVKGRGDGRARGKVVKTQVRAFDVMPTLLELAGIAPEGDLQAESLAALLAPDAPDAPDRIAVTESSRGSIGLRNQDWKYILGTPPGKARPSEALFDLRQDPGEEQDVALERPDVCARMRVQALDYVLRNKPGHYLVAIADGASSSTYAVEGVRTARSLFGPAPLQDGPNRFVFQGQSSDPLVGIADLAPDGDILLEGARVGPDDLPRYRAGDLERLLSKPQTGLHLFAGPPPFVQDVGRQSVDQGQLDALKALGYVGDDP